MQLLDSYAIISNNPERSPGSPSGKCLANGRTTSPPVLTHMSKGPSSVPPQGSLMVPFLQAHPLLSCPLPHNSLELLICSPPC